MVIPLAFRGRLIPMVALLRVPVPSGPKAPIEPVRIVEVANSCLEPRKEMLQKVVVCSFSPPLADLGSFCAWVTKTWKWPVSCKRIPGDRMLVVIDAVADAGRIIQRCF
ncbi:hypothetical protein AMTR_s00046p00144360 [Amborella trichopoda]|uniref:Uncharacterized protein n=1 Tax=Amborella trichopoda TaxID=13333 RepID=U5D6Y2_AMBTC|nr:hypothetical protein AMTR_s00046p00144360 [Amborella trichopoda]